MKMKHSNLLVTETKVVPGVFRCGSNDDGLRIEIVDACKTGVSMKIGVGGNLAILIEKHSALTLRDFFADLANIL